MRRGVSAVQDGGVFTFWLSWPYWVGGGAHKLIGFCPHDLEAGFRFRGWACPRRVIGFSGGLLIPQPPSADDFLARFQVLAPAIAAR